MTKFKKPIMKQLTVRSAVSTLECLTSEAIRNMRRDASYARDHDLVAACDAWLYPRDGSDQSLPDGWRVCALPDPANAGSAYKAVDPKWSPAADHLGRELICRTKAEANRLAWETWAIQVIRERIDRT